MSDFYKKFLLDDVRRMGGGSGRQIFLGAFGKHPGWDDHVEDLGLESESLIFAKTRLYVEGIGSQIDKGDWEKLDAQQQVPAFKHIFVWERAGQFLIGRMWSSSDGKGRTRYPMIVCAHCAGVSLSWALDRVLPVIEKVEQECLQTKSAADVRFILTSARNRLRSALNEVATEITPTPPAVTSEAVGEFLAHPDLGPQQEGWMRLLYQMQSQMAQFAIGKFSLKGDSTGIRPQQLRVPPCANSAHHSIVLWTRFFQSQLDPAVPVLLTLPIEERWLDATFGEPTPHEFFCLRASPKSVPLVSEVPYNLDPDFRKNATTLLASFQDGKPASGLAAHGANAPTSSGFSSTKSKLLKWFGGGAALLVVLAGLAIYVSGARKEKPPPARAEQPPANAPPASQQSPPVEAQNAEKARLAAEAETRVKAAAEAQQMAEAKRTADSQRLAEERRVAAEKAKAEADARASQEREKLRLAAEAEASRMAEQKRKAEQEAQLKAQTEAREKAVLVAANAQSPPRKEPTPAQPASETSTSRQMTNSIGMVLVKMPGNYWAGKFEVTQAEYEKIIGANPSKSSGKKQPRLPVESISWNDAMKFCDKLTAAEKAAGALTGNAVYTLPTEKQWNECLGDAKFEDAVTSDAGRRESPSPVGSGGAPNNLGLFDVFGNVWEWCLEEGEAHQKLLLGGAYNSLKSYGLKRQLAADKQSYNLGFRCVLVPAP